VRRLELWGVRLHQRLFPDGYLLSLTRGAEAWAPLTLSGNGPQGSIIGMTYDSQAGSFIVYALSSQRGAFDLYRLTPGAQAWTWSALTRAVDQPGQRRRHGALMDSTRTLYIFFGEDAPGGSLLGDAWSYNAGAWTPLPQFGVLPSKRAGFAWTALSTGATCFPDYPCADDPPFYLHGGLCETSPGVTGLCADGYSGSPTNGQLNWSAWSDGGTGLRRDRITPWRAPRRASCAWSAEMERAGPWPKAGT
jgi:hypothetical protein